MADSLDRIIEACKTTLAENGLSGCTVDRVAARAGVAKGLVNYHFRSKRDLLDRVGASLRQVQLDQRVCALERATGARALDELWDTLVTNAQPSGPSAARLSLAVDPTTRGAGKWTRQEAQAQSTAAEKALSVPSGTLLPSLVIALLDGIELQLLVGESRSDLREAYDRYWLSLLPP